MTVPLRKKLIEVALPLEAINIASAREKSIRFGHPSTLHLWWARRPLAAARAVIFAQMVDDPASRPDIYPTVEAQEKARMRLFRLIENLVQWENSTNEEVLAPAREEIWKSWRHECAINRDHPEATALFNPDVLPGFHDPFAGGGAIPLEAQRLGLESYASDLNPVPVLINKAMIEIPSRFAGKPPVNPDASKGQLGTKTWRGAQGLAEDVRHYGQWIRDEAERRIGHFYQKVTVSSEMMKERPDLKPLLGQELTIIAWLWARTVKSPNPAFREVEVPLASTFILSTKPGKEAYIEPVVGENGYHFTVRAGISEDAEGSKSGTKLARGANFKCVMSGTPISGDHIKSEGRAGRIGVRMMAMVAESDLGRVFLSPTADQEVLAKTATPKWRPEGGFVEDARAFTPCLYGLNEWQKLFTDRQLTALTTYSELITEVTTRIRMDAAAALGQENENSLENGGNGAVAYGDAVATYLAIALSRLTDICNSLCRWEVTKTQVRNLFGRQAIPMMWDFAENNVFAGAAGDYIISLGNMAKALERLPARGQGAAVQSEAQKQTISRNKVISTDPPYYDNVPYADLSDFFYVWLRKSLQTIFPKLFATLAVPKAEELVATSYRHGSKLKAEEFFLTGMTGAMHQLAVQAHAAFPVTIYYAFKQSESDDGAGTASTGWETFLDAVIRAGFATTGTWPMRTELENRMRGTDSNALASSIVLVCRRRPTDAPTATRREFVAALQQELPDALRHLQAGNIAPVDLAQAAIGPGMAVFTRYAKVLDAQGTALSVRDALALINETLDAALAEQEGDFDSDTRWALAWFEQHGFAEGEFGVAETLSKAKNTSLRGLEDAHILESRRGKVRLFRPEELPSSWDPTSDTRLTHWETVHQLIRVLDSGGESAAATLVAKLGSKAEAARELAYRLYTVCERKKRAAEALRYNGLVQSWTEISRLSQQAAKPAVTPAQTDLF